MNTHIDPVCGMTVDSAISAGKFEYDGKTYYFCNPHCLHKFSANPQAFLNKPSGQTMHAQPVQLAGKSNQSDDCERGDDFQLSFSYCERAEIEKT